MPSPCGHDRLIPNRSAAQLGAARRGGAADLAVAFKELGIAFERHTGEHVVFTFGSTGLLEKQIAEGAPFDLFAAANVSYADDAIRAGACAPGQDPVRARPTSAVVAQRHGAATDEPCRPDGRALRQDRDQANPAHAPYGKSGRAGAGEGGPVGRRSSPSSSTARTSSRRCSSRRRATPMWPSSRSRSPWSRPKATSLALPERVITHRSIRRWWSVAPTPIDSRARASSASFLGSPTGREIMTRYGFLLPRRDEDRLRALAWRRDRNGVRSRSRCRSGWPRRS